MKYSVIQNFEGVDVIMVKIGEGSLVKNFVTNSPLSFKNYMDGLIHLIWNERNIL